MLCPEVAPASIRPINAAAANTLYVSTSGNDGTGCTKIAPCQTIGAAVARAATGDTVAVERGTYRESVTVDKAGHWVHHDRLDGFLAVTHRFLGV